MTCRIAHKLCVGLLVCLGFAVHASTFQRTEYGYYNLRDDSKEIYQISLVASQDKKQLEINMSGDNDFRYRAAIIRCAYPGTPSENQRVYMLKPLFFQPDSKPRIGDIQNSYLSNRPLPMWLYTAEGSQQVLVGSGLKLIMMLGEDLSPLPSQNCNGDK